MDPFTSLSIATAVITIIDFAAKIATVIKEVHENGSIRDHTDLKTLSLDFEGILRNLKQSMAMEFSAAELQIQEQVCGLYVCKRGVSLVVTCVQELLALGAQTASVAGELASILEYVERERSTSRAVNTISHVFRATATKKKVTESMEKLERFKNELVLRLVVSLKLHTRFQEAKDDKRYQALQKETRQIASALLDNKNFFTTGIGKLMRDSEVESQRAQIRHEETIATIATLQGSRSKGLFEFPETALQEDKLQDLDKIQEVLLNFLWFRFMRDRELEVAEAYESTFQWAFSPDMPGFNEWDRLSSWLRQGGGCYWVNGKAGSGKSTFMKFLLGSQRTKDLLSEWADGQPLRCASFFFWASGGIPLQRSQEGLLRSLLHSILTQSPELIPIVFPVLSRKFARKSLVLHEPSLSELKEAFSLMTSQTASPTKIVLFIDGLDELLGDHIQLIEFLRSRISPNVKIILSSRPIPACVQGVGCCASLELQQLTRSDIEAYVKGNTRASLSGLWHHDSEAIIQAIVDKSCGVFLWVSLVCKALSTELANSAHVDEIWNLLDELPTDFDQLYIKIFRSLDPKHKTKLYFLLRIMYHAIKSLGLEKTTLLRVSYAMDDNPDALLDAKIEPAGSLDYDLCRRMRGFIQGRSCGLLEVQSMNSRSSDNTQQPSPPLTEGAREVRLLHKSVAEFLEKEEIWAEIHSQATSNEVHPGISLLCALLREIKVTGGTSESGTQYQSVISKARYVLKECACVEEMTEATETMILEELQEVLHHHWRTDDRWKQWRGLGPVHWFSHIGGFHLSKEPPFNCILFLAARHGLVQYVKNALERPDEASDGFQVTPAQTVLEGLFYANEPRFSADSWRYGLKILELCIEHGVNLRQREALFVKYLPRGLSAWHRALDWEPTHATEWQIWLKVLQTLLAADIWHDLIYRSWVTDYYSEFKQRLDEVYSDLYSIRVRICQSPLALFRDRYTMASQLAESRSAARKIRLIHEDIRRNFLSKGFEEQEWSEVYLASGWAAVQDPQLEKAIFRAHRLSNVRYPK